MQTTRVTLIPPTMSLHTAAPLSKTAVRRVCGYARVSTDNEEQLGSYEAQMAYYTQFIQEHEVGPLSGSTAMRASPAPASASARAFRR